MEWIRDAAIFLSGVLAFWAGHLLAQHNKSRIERYNENTLEQDNIRLRMENNTLMKENNALRERITTLEKEVYELKVWREVLEEKLNMNK